jgi:cytochrome P450
MLGANFLGSLIGIMKKYPIITPFLPLFVPWSVLRSLPSIIKDNRVEVQKRIDRRGNTKHPDYFDQLLPADKPAPTNTKELRHLRTIAGQLVLGGFDPVSGLFFTTIFFLLKNSEILDLLTKEIRTKFQSYRDIEPDNLLQFQYLNACLQETLRLNATATQGGLPRVCPGAVINGEYIPKGVSVPL